MNQIAVQPRKITQVKATQPELQQFVYDDSIVRKFLVAMYAWGIVAFLAGIFVALLWQAAGKRG